MSSVTLQQQCLYHIKGICGTTKACGPLFHVVDISVKCCFKNDGVLYSASNLAGSDIPSVSAGLSRNDGRSQSVLSGDDVGTRRSALVNWYLAEVEAELESETELVERKTMVEKVIYRLVHHVSILFTTVVLHCVFLHCYRWHACYATVCSYKCGTDVFLIVYHEVVLLVHDGIDARHRTRRTIVVVMTEYYNYVHHVNSA